MELPSDVGQLQALVVELSEQVAYLSRMLFGRRSEKLAEYLTRGKQVYVEGRIQSRSYEDKDGKKQYYTEVVADDVILLGGRGADAGGGVPFADEEHSGMVSRPRNAEQQRPRATGAPSSAPAAPEPPLSQGIGDEDVPF